MSKRRVFIINFISSLTTQVVALVLGLIIPRIILNNYGSDTNGLISTVSQIFSYLALLEAGISTSARNAMYRPMSSNDREEVSRIVSISRRTFRRIAYIYLAAVFLLAFIVPLILKSNVNYWTIFGVVIFEGLTNVVSFYFISVWSTVLFVGGKSYVNNIILLISNVLCYSIKILLVSLSANIVLIQIGFFIVSLGKVVLYYLYFRKHYPWINYKSANKKERLPDRTAYIITEVAWTVFSSTDLIVIGIFLSTSHSSIYAVYNMVILALNGILNAAYGGISYCLGIAFAESKEKYTKIHDMFNSFFMSAITILMSVSYLLLIPFVKLYTNGITDINYIYEWLPLLFCLVPILSWSRYVAGNLSGIGGFAKQTGVVSLIEAAINVVLSIILVNFIGLYGVLIATVVALPIKVVWLNWIADCKILKRSPKRTVLILLSNYAIFACCIIFKVFYGEFNINSWLELVFYGFVLTFVISIVVISVNMVINKNMFGLLKIKRKINE